MSSIPNAIIAAAQAQGVDPALALEVAYVESGFNQNAVSSKGAIGVFQLEPATAAGMGVDPTDAQQNIQGGVSYLRQMLAQFGDPRAALAAYNWGPGNVKSAIAANGSGWFSTIPGSVQNYVNTILGNLQTQYSAVTAFAAATGGATPGGGTSVMTLPAALSPAPPAAAPAGFSWGGAALLMGIIFGVGLALYEI